MFEGSVVVHLDGIFVNRCEYIIADLVVIEVFDCDVYVVYLWQVAIYVFLYKYGWCVDDVIVVGVQNCWLIDCVVVGYCRNFQIFGGGLLCGFVSIEYFEIIIKMEDVDWFFGQFGVFDGYGVDEVVVVVVVEVIVGQQIGVELLVDYGFGEGGFGFGLMLDLYFLDFICGICGECDCGLLVQCEDVD